MGGWVDTRLIRSVGACICAPLLQAVVRDVRGLGVMYAPQLCAFTCLAGPKEAIQQRASLPELTALLQVGAHTHG